MEIGPKFSPVGDGIKVDNKAGGVGEAGKVAAKAVVPAAQPVHLDNVAIGANLTKKTAATGSVGNDDNTTKGAAALAIGAATVAFGPTGLAVGTFAVMAAKFVADHGADLTAVRHG